MKDTISIYVRNSNLGPSDYYRICQYIPYFDKKCIIHEAVNEKEFKKNLDLQAGLQKKLYQLYLFIRIYIRRLMAIKEDIKNHRRIIIIQREVFPHIMGVLAGRLLRRLCQESYVIWDFDDDVFYNNEIGMRERRVLFNYVYRIVVTSEYLKKRLPPCTLNRTMILPTTDGFCKGYDFEMIKGERQKSYIKQVQIVWVGTASNMRNLNHVIDAIDNASIVIRKKYNKQTILSVVCNKEYNYATKCLIIKNIEWDRKVAENTIAESHIGIMPLEDNIYALGKGGFKLIQYISLHLPVVASAVGYNNEIVTPEIGYLINNDNIKGWTDALVRLSGDFNQWEMASDSAGIRYNTQFSIDYNIEQWKKLLEVTNY